MAELSVPQIDFSALGQLPGIYNQAQTDAKTKMVLSQLGQGAQADTSALMGSGIMPLAQLGLQMQNHQDALHQQEIERARNATNDAFNHSIATANLGIARANLANNSEGPEEIAAQRANVAKTYGLDPATPEGRSFIVSGRLPDTSDTPTARATLARQYGIDPTTPEGRSFVLTGKLPDMTAPNNYELNPDFGKVEGAPKLRPISGGPADPTTKASGILDEDTIKAMAKQARAGDTSVYQNLGRGAQGAENIVRLRQEVARQNADAGVSGEEQALRNAEMAGVKAGQRTIGTKGANIEMAATEFNQVLPVVQAVSQSVSRTNYPDLNKILLAAETKTGDPNVVKLGSGINTLINLYARAISPTGVPTVEDKKNAREILAASWSNGQFDAATGMMQKEIDASLASPEKVRDEMRRRFLKGQGAAPVGYPAPGGSPAAAPAGVVDYKTYFGQ